MADSSKRVRLLKVAVQATFVVDDGESLEEQTGQAVVVNAADWPAFAERLEADRAATEEAMNHDPA
jgi:hypothetical protein